MSDNQFLDTNILVYALATDDTESKTEQALNLLKKCLRDGTGVISTQVLQEFYHTTTKKISEPIEPGQAEDFLGKLEDLRLVLVDQTIIHEAIKLDEEEQLSFWDALICSAANRAGCDVVYTEDLNAGQEYGSVTAKNPFS